MNVFLKDYGMWGLARRQIYVLANPLVVNNA